MNIINICELASVFSAYQSSKENYKATHLERLEMIFDRLPSGSGMDAGVKFNFDESTTQKLVFNFGFHHMDENGSYDGWTEHKITIRPSFVGGFDLKISGRDRNGIKSYLYDTFYEVFCFIPNYQSLI